MMGTIYIYYRNSTKEDELNQLAKDELFSINAEFRVENFPSRSPLPLPKSTTPMMGHP